MVTIKYIKARQIYDSRGKPTIEAEVHLDDGTFARAAVPSGAFTDFVDEALDLINGGRDYMLNRVLKHVNEIIGPALVGKDTTQQTAIDNFMVQELDGMTNELGWCNQKLGANATLAVSLAVCKAGAKVKKIPLYKHIAELAGNKKLVLPVPAFSVINGGSHAGDKLAMQDFMILPIGASSFSEAMMMASEVYLNLKSLIRKKYGQDATNVGDEGSFTPNIQEIKGVLELLKTAIEKAGYNGKVFIGVDFAASEFYKEDKTYDFNFKEEKNDGSQRSSVDALKDLYESLAAEHPTTFNLLQLLLQNNDGLLRNSVDALKDQYNSFVAKHPILFGFLQSFLQNNDGSQRISGDALKDLYESFVAEYPIVSIEHPFDQDDWEQYAKLTAEIGYKVQIVGDDLFVTNPKRILETIDKKACNALLLKVNQMGSVTKSIDAVKMSKRAGWGVMANHRSGEIEDTFIADLSVGLATGQIKTGAPFRSERLAKYNELLRIEEELGAEAVYAGVHFRQPTEPY